MSTSRMPDLPYAELTARAEKKISDLMLKAKVIRNRDMARSHEDWAYGAFLLWDSLTIGWRYDEADHDRLLALTKLARSPFEAESDF